MSLWKPVDWLALKIAESFTPVWQMRLGVVMVLAGLVLVLGGFVTSEPPLIYQMSAWALVIGGLGFLVTALLALREDPEASEEDLKP